MSHSGVSVRDMSILYITVLVVIFVVVLARILRRWLHVKLRRARLVLQGLVTIPVFIQTHSALPSLRG